MSPMVPGVSYDEEELRRLYAAGVAPEGYTYEDEDDDDSPEPNYACATCGEEIHISEHKRRAPAWCNDCGGIKSHERLPQKS